MHWHLHHHSHAAAGQRQLAWGTQSMQGPVLTGYIHKCNTNYREHNCIILCFRMDDQSQHEEADAELFRKAHSKRKQRGIKNLESCCLCVLREGQTTASRQVCLSIVFSASDLILSGVGRCKACAGWRAQKENKGASYTLRHVGYVS